MNAAQGLSKVIKVQKLSLQFHLLLFLENYCRTSSMWTWTSGCEMKSKTAFSLFLPPLRYESSDVTKLMNSVSRIFQRMELEIETITLFRVVVAKTPNYAIR